MQPRLRRETVRLLNRLHQWDVLRANKTPFAWGVETRVPFLDKAFLELVMNIDPKEKMVCSAPICCQMWNSLDHLGSYWSMICMQRFVCSL